MGSQPYSHSHPTSLGLSRRVLTVLVKLNLLMGFLITALLIASLVAEGPVMGALGVRGKGDNSTLILGMRTIMVIGICAVPVAYIILTRLLSMVDTVRNGDPFVAENATVSQPLDIHWSFSVTRWLVVLLLFVLARVFDQGTRMREELEATV